MKFKRLAIAVAAASLMLAGCGGGSDSKAADDTSKDGGSSASITKANFASVISKAQAEAKSGHMSMKLGLGGQSVPAEADFETGARAESTKMKMTMGLAGQSIEMRLIDQVLYMKFGEMTQGKFVKIDLTDPDNPLRKQFGSLIDQADPSKSLETYQDSLKSFEKSGEPQKIDGVDAQPYKLVLDAKKYIKEMGAGDTPGAQGLDDITVTLYIASDNLIRRSTTTVSGADVTVDFSKWGEAISVEKPSADQIGDSSQLEKMMSGQLGAAKS